MSPGTPRWLLIGNSRWHWAEMLEGRLKVWDLPCLQEPPGRSLAPGPLDRITAWAAVGPVPTDGRLSEESRVSIVQVPLTGSPPWLGVDRALAGWQAWTLADGPVMVADAGTVLSLTRVDSRGHFLGGRLQPGVALQLQALASGTAALPAMGLDLPWGIPRQRWPVRTGEAMLSGVLRGLTAALTSAVLEVIAEDPLTRIVLTGGDAPVLEGLLRKRLADQPPVEAVVELRPTLVMEGLARLRPGKGR